MKRLLTILMTVLLLFSSVLTTRIVYAEGEEYISEENTEYLENAEGEEAEAEEPYDEEILITEEESETEEMTSQEEEIAVSEEANEEAVNEGQDDTDSIDIDEDHKKDGRIYTIDDIVSFDDPKLNYHRDETDTSAFILSENTEETFDLPAQYDLREHGDVTSIKNQGSYGTCWAHATLGSAESSYLKKYGRELDLSEAHLAYFAYHNIDTPDELSLITNDGLEILTEDEQGLLQGGGNTLMASYMIASGIGPIYESEMPYNQLPSSGDVSESFFQSYEDDGYCYKQSDYYLDDVKWFDITDSQAVKNAIMNFGAVTVSYFALSSYSGVKMDDGTIFWEADFMNHSTNAYYNYAVQGTNHAVLIVGWDDNFSKDNFVTSPNNDGAWLIKNSWGTWYGDNGYFWISYEDVGLFSSDTICQLNIESTNGEMLEYQYAGTNPSMRYSFSNNAYAGNIYYAKGEELLKKVSFVTGQSDTTCTIEIYTGVGSNPRSGNKVATKTVTENYAGIHTIDLDEAVQLSAGQKFSVVVHQRYSGRINVWVTKSYSYGWCQMKDKTATGQSFISSDGSSWTDLSSNNNCTALVTAYTTPAPSGEQYYITYHNTKNAENRNPASFTEGSYNGVLELYDLEKNGYEFLGWYTDPEFENPITSIDTTEPQDYDLYADWDLLEYSITYELDGGDNSENNPDFYTVEDEFVLEDATKEYYDFVGWYLEGEGYVDRIEEGHFGSLTLYAVFVPHDYLITYDLDGGTAMGNPDYYNIETEDFYLVNPVKRGYIFTGWTGTDLDELTEDVVIYQGSAGDRHYIAHYVPDPNTQYVVNHFKQNIDESWPDEPFESELFSTETGSVVYPEVKEYEGFTSPDEEEATVAADGSTTVNYYYTRNSYFLSVEEGYGVREVIHKDEYKYEEEVTLEVVLEAGYENAEFSGDFDVPVFRMPADDVLMEVNAQLKEYSITYDLNGGELDDENPSFYTVESDDILLERPYKEYYDFIGWTGTDLEVPTLDVIIVSGSLGDRHYVANYVPVEFEITYDLDEGETEKENPVSYNIECDDIILCNPSKRGYRFIGWMGTDLDEETMEVVIRKGSTGDREYYANYEICEYSITYVLNDSDEYPAYHFNPDGYSCEDEFELDDAVREGFLFEGWYLDEELTQKVEVIDSAFDGDLTIYASWTPISYTVIFDFNGLKDETETYTWNFAEEYELPVSDDIYYRIYGWSYESDGEIDFEEGTTVKDLTVEDGEVITLYAIWDYKYQVSVPYADPESGSEVEKGTAVSLFCDTENVEIRYTLDGSDPDEGSLLYEDPIIIEEDTFIEAVAYAENFKESEIAFFEYYISYENEYGNILPEDQDTYDELGRPEGLWLSRLEYLPDGIESEVIYTGKPITLSFRVYYGKALLSEGGDYSVKYANNTKAASSEDAKAPSVTITGKGNYVGTLKKTFDIYQKEMDESNTLVLLNKDCFIENGKVQKPTVTSVVCDSVKLKKNTDYEVRFPDSKDPDEYSLEIRGKGNYSGSLIAYYSIIEKNTLKSVSGLKVTGMKNYPFASELIEQDPDSLKVKDGTALLVEGEHYFIDRYVNNYYAGTAYMVLVGLEEGGYKGELFVPFKITALKLSAKMASVELDDGEYQYTGTSYTPEPLVYFGDTLLEEGEDYTVSYKNNINAGNATVSVKGKGGYSGTLNRTFKISKVDIVSKSNETEIVMDNSYPYEKSGVKPLPEVIVNGRTLALNKDYTLAYKDNTKQGTASLTIKGKGNYEGSLTKPFAITKKDISDTVISMQDKPYANKVNAWKSVPALTDSNGKKLVAGTDYEKSIIYTYKYDTIVTDGSVKSKPEVLRSEGEEVGKSDILPYNTIVSVTVTGKGNYSGTITGDYRIVKQSIAKATAMIPTQYYTGKPIILSKSDIKVKLGKEVLTSKDYDIVSYSNNIAKGTAKVTIRGKGNYGGTKALSFKIAQRSFGMTIRFNGNGATSGSMKDLVIYKNTALTANAFKKTVDGKAVQFLGWNTKPDGTGTSYDNKAVINYSIFKAGSITTLYAMWEDTGYKKIAVLIPYRGDKSYFDAVASAADEVHAANNGITVDVFECDPNYQRKEANWMNWYDNLCEDGKYDLIVSGGSDLQSFLFKACEKYPKQMFYCFDYDSVPSTGAPANCYCTKPDISHIGYAVGALTAAVTKNDRAAVIVGMDSQSMNQFIGGYCQALADKEIEYLIAYPGSFSDFELGKVVAESIVAKGADVIWQVAGGLGNGVIDVCSKNEDVWAIGIDQDQYLQFKDTKPEWANTILTSGLKRYDNIFKSVCEMLIDGTISSKLGKAEKWGIPQNGVGIAENEFYLANTTPEIREEYETTLDRVRNGEVKVVDVMDWDYDTYENEWPKVRDANRVE